MHLKLCVVSFLGLEYQRRVSRLAGITALYNKHFGLGYRLKFADPKFRAGQADTTLSDIHLFAKIKKGKVNDEFILEINYIALLAHSGAYKILGTQEAGVHEGDWEHLTVRCTTEGKLLAGTDQSLMLPSLACDGGGPPSRRIRSPAVAFL